MGVTRNCRPEMVEFAKTKGLDLSTHQSSYVFEDILENDYIVVSSEQIKQKVIAMDRKSRARETGSKKYVIITLQELVRNQELTLKTKDSIYDLCSLAIKN